MSFSGPPEYYADSVKMSFTPYGFNFEFGLQTGSPNETKSEAIVRMSPQHALVYYQFLKNALRDYEAKVGKITLPDNLFSELKLEKGI